MTWASFHTLDRYAIAWASFHTLARYAIVIVAPCHRVAGGHQIQRGGWPTYAMTGDSCRSPLGAAGLVVYLSVFGPLLSSLVVTSALVRLKWQLSGVRPLIGVSPCIKYIVTANAFTLC